MTSIQPEGTQPHFVMPLSIYEKHRDKINEVTNGEFNPMAMYNVVFLYTEPTRAQHVGTIMYGTDLSPLEKKYSELLDQTWDLATKDEQLAQFKGLHSFFREAVWVDKSKAGSDPCALQNPIPPNVKKSLVDKLKFWK